MSKYNLTFNDEEMRIIDEALCNMPYKKVTQLIQNINIQIQKDQLQKQEFIDSKENDT